MTSNSTTSFTMDQVRRGIYKLSQFLECSELDQLPEEDLVHLISLETLSPCDLEEFLIDNKSYVEDLVGKFIGSDNVQSYMTTDYEEVLKDFTSTESDMRVYLASPFFSTSEMLTVAKLEVLLHSLGVNVYSPSREGGVILTDGHLDKVKIFEDNVRHVEDNELMIAVIDNRDAGTMVELGMKYQYDKLTYNKGVSSPARILTYSANNYRINIMLLGAILRHHMTLEGLSNSIMEYFEGSFEYDLTEVLSNESY